MKHFNFATVEGILKTDPKATEDGVAFWIVNNPDAEILIECKGRLGVTANEQLKEGSRILVSGRMKGNGVVLANDINFLNKG